MALLVSSLCPSGDLKSVKILCPQMSWCCLTITYLVGVRTSSVARRVSACAHTQQEHVLVHLLMHEVFIQSASHVEAAKCSEPELFGFWSFYSERCRNTVAASAKTPR